MDCNYGSLIGMVQCLNMAFFPLGYKLLRFGAYRSPYDHMNACDSPILRIIAGGT